MPCITHPMAQWINFNLVCLPLCLVGPGELNSKQLPLFNADSGIKHKAADRMAIDGLGFKRGALCRLYQKKQTNKKSIVAARDWFDLGPSRERERPDSPCPKSPSPDSLLPISPSELEPLTGLVIIIAVL